MAVGWEEEGGEEVDLELLDVSSGWDSCWDAYITRGAGGE